MAFWRLIALLTCLSIALSLSLVLTVDFAAYGEVVASHITTGFVVSATCGFLIAYIAALVLQTIRRSEKQLRLAMRGTADGLWDWNLLTNDVYYSPQWKAMLGYEEHELECHFDTWSDLVHPDDKARVLSKVQDYASGRSDSFEVEMRMQCKDGREVIVLSRAYLLRNEIDNKPIRLIGTHVDITKRHAAEVYVTNNAKILEMIASGSPASDVYDAIATMYEQRHPGLRCSMLELEGNRLLHGGAPSLPKAYCDAVDGLINGPDVGSCGSSTYTGERVLVEDIKTDEKWRDLKTVALPHGMRCCWSEPIKNHAGEVLGAFGMYFDYPALPNDQQLEDLIAAARLTGIVMERDQAQKRIKQLAYSDELTGIANRTRFYQYFDDLIRQAKRLNRRFALLYVDLDDFKHFNDTLGHDVGDTVLREVAKRLVAVSRDIDFVCRLAGDEFCILVQDAEGDFDAAHVAKRCLKALPTPIDIKARKLFPACSIGIARYPDDGEDCTELMKAADMAMYTAKGLGKNQYAFYDSELTKKAERRFKFEHALKDAIEQQTMTLVYQPQVDLISGKVVGVEALARWQHPEFGKVPPNEFVEAAEQIGMMCQLTEWVLFEACRQAVAWEKSGGGGLRMAVNISPTQFLRNDFVPLIRQVISETGITPSELELEITEAMAQTDKSNTKVLSELKALGVMLAIDDFGTGYSSFASLKHLPIDSLKIDKYFIDDLGDDEETYLLLKSMIELGHLMGYAIVAEGVEVPQQLDRLKDLNCELAQGYYLSQPLEPDALEPIINNGRKLAHINIALH